MNEWVEGEEGVLQHSTLHTLCVTLCLLAYPYLQPANISASLEQRYLVSQCVRDISCVTNMKPHK